MGAPTEWLFYMARRRIKFCLCEQASTRLSSSVAYRRHLPRWGRLAYAKPWDDRLFILIKALLNLEALLTNDSIIESKDFCKPSPAWEKDEESRDAPCSR